MSKLRVAMITREWPPKVYGGAGVHVNNLVQAMRSLKSDLVSDLKGGASFELPPEVDVHCFDGERSDAHGYQLGPELAGVNPAIATLLIDHDIAMKVGEVNLVHSHTWYANFAGDLAKRVKSIPHVVTAHSLEPLRPWKAEQLGSGYAISSWIEEMSYRNADAIISVSDGMREDILKTYPFLDPAKVTTIYNGIDCERFAPNPSSLFREARGVAGPYALFVGRITRQKGLAHLLRAWKRVDPELGLVIAAGNPDEPGIAQEVEHLIKELQSTRSNIWWFPSMLAHDELTELLSAAELFLCPSVYEPLGIVNLEAMACQCPVVASAVGGIPEVVIHGVTGDLVPHSAQPDEFESDFADTVNLLFHDDARRKRYAIAGRERVQAQFGWDRIAASTLDLYRSLIH